MFHEPLNDLGREQVYADLIAWLRARVPHDHGRTN
jgi:hypothetical protein